MGTLLRNTGCRIRRYVLEGINTVMIENRYVRVTILESKGADIVELLYKPRDIDVLFKTPWGIESPSNLTTTSSNPAGIFLDYYEGGWQTIFPVGGGPDTYLGAFIGRHGELHTVPWKLDIVKDEPDEVAVSFRTQTRRTPFDVTKTVTLREGSATVGVTETIRNLSPLPFDVMWGEHIAFGEPFLGDSLVLTTSFTQGEILEGSCPPNSPFPPGVYQYPNFETKSGEIVDVSQIQKTGSGTTNLFFLTHPKSDDDTWCALSNPDLGFGVRLGWSGTVFPCAWIWHENNGTKSYPWYQRVKVLGVEPFSSYPPGLGQAIQRGNQLKFEAFESKSIDISVDFFEV